MLVEGLKGLGGWQGRAGLPAVTRLLFFQSRVRSPINLFIHFFFLSRVRSPIKLLFFLSPKTLFIFSKSGKVTYKTFHFFSKSQKTFDFF